MLAVVGETGNRWVDSLIAVSLVLVALGVIWTKAVRPVVRVARVLDQVLPVLIDIGQQFHENGGHTLKDSLVRIEGQLGTNSRQVSDLAVKHEELHTYAHDTRHEQRNQITELVLSDQIVTRKIDDLAAKVALSARTGDRIEAAQTVVAEDLAASVGRADNVQGAEGAAADAASRSPEIES